MKFLCCPAVMQFFGKDDGSEESKDLVEYRPVTLGQSLDGLRVINAVKRDAEGKITEGLAGGERVIIGGMQRVRPGSVVQASAHAPPKPPGSPLVKLLQRNQGSAGE